MSELITNDTSEPQDTGVVFISNEYGVTVAIGTEYGWARPGVTDSTWEEIIHDYLGCTLESLSEHQSLIHI